MIFEEVRVDELAPGDQVLIPRVAEEDQRLATVIEVVPTTMFAQPAVIYSVNEDPQNTTVVLRYQDFAMDRIWKAVG